MNTLYIGRKTKLEIKMLSNYAYKDLGPAKITLQNAFQFIA